MIPLLMIGGVLLGGAVVFCLLRRTFWSASASDRLGESIAMLSPFAAEVAAGDRTGADVVSQRWLLQPLSRPLRWVPLAIGCVVSFSLWLLTAFPISIVLSIGLVVGLLLAQVEKAWHHWRIGRIELQLIDLLDMMIPMLRSGAGASAALSSASEVTASPLRDQIHWCVRRIQLGDSGSTVFQALSRRIPIDAMELFATTMSVHWETGGSLAPVLASVARVARDRQEVDRRIRSNVAQSQFSTIAVLVLIYFVALVLWLDRPDVMQEFASSSIGSAAIAATIILQAVGIVWMNVISRPKG